MQKERLRQWILKTVQNIESEGKEIVLGGDFNCDPRITENDGLGKFLREDLMDSTGLEMIVKEPTHQEIRKGKPCRNRLIDHIYTNHKQKVQKVHVRHVGGCHHKLIVAEPKRNVNSMAPNR